MEIEETRREIERDLVELEDRIPSPLRSAKAAAGAIIGSSTIAALSGWLLKRRRARRLREDRSTEIVVRVVRDDVDAGMTGATRP
jgi:hypothetical protein